MKIESVENRALICAVAAVLLWSTVATGFKLGLQHLYPAQLLLTGAMFSLLLFTIAISRVPSHITSLSQVVRAGLYGMLNPLVYYLVLFEAYSRLPAHVAQPLNYMWAITLAILAVPILKQRLNARTSIGILIGYVGVVVLITKGKMVDFEHFDPLGVLLALVSTVIWALYWLYATKQTMHSYWFLWIGFACATPLLFVYCALSVGLPDLSAPTFIFGLWIGLIEMGFAFLLWHFAVSNTKNVARVSQLIFISPFISMLLINFVLDEQIHESAILALILIVMGLYVVNRRQESHVDQVR